MEQASEKCFVSISLQGKNIETKIQNREREREKINQKLRNKYIAKQQLEHDQRHVLQKLQTTEEIHPINKNNHQELPPHIAK